MRASDRRVRREFASGFMVVECAANRQPPGDRTHSDCKFVRFFFSLYLNTMPNLSQSYICAPASDLQYKQFNLPKGKCAQTLRKTHGTTTMARGVEQIRSRPCTQWRTHTRCSTHHLYACRRTERGISTDAQCAKQSSRSTHLTQDGPPPSPKPR